MSFWNLAFIRKWVDIDQLRVVVKTVDNPYGEITPAEFKQITGVEF